MKNKKIIYIIIGVIVVLLIGFFLLLSNQKKKETSNDNPKENKEDLLERIGKNFYEDYYHPEVLTVAGESLMNNLAQTGISISVSAIDVITPINKETKEYLDTKKCDYENTKIFIYPKEPFGISDYTIKVDLACEK